MGATDTLKAAVESLSTLSTLSTPVSKNDITLNDLSAALRQQVRYTCRLNHIAAHTAIWSIGTFKEKHSMRVLLKDVIDFHSLL